MTNKYLVTRSGRFVGNRGLVALTTFGPMAASAFIGVGGMIVADVLGAPALAVACGLIAFLLFAAPVIAAWVFLVGGSKQVVTATQAWHAGNYTHAIELCQKPLARVFRADIRTRALYVLGLVAESNADFAEAADLFRRASEAMPAMAASKYQRHARCLMLCHHAIALVALRRLDDADFAVRTASQLFLPTSPGVFDAFTDDAAFGPMGISTALRDIEIGRDPRALLTLASVAVLAARGMGREAIELVDRERFTLNSGLLPRERALVANVEARIRGQLGGGPMRAPGVVDMVVSDPWAERVLPLRG